MTKNIQLGLLFGVASGMIWGLIFMVPVVLPEYPPAMLSAGRYLAFGLICLPLAGLVRKQLALYHFSDWCYATVLSLLGNILYYWMLAGSVQRIGAAVTSVILGAVPVTSALISNWGLRRQGKGVSWTETILPLIVIVAGILLANFDDYVNRDILGSTALSEYFEGLLMALGGLVVWTIYALKNADWLHKNPQKTPATWATAQGLATLPLAILSYAAWRFFGDVPADFNVLGPRPIFFVLIMIATGFFASWVGTLFWNQASQRLPRSLAGQMIVFETIFALIYAYSLRQEWPPLTMWVGVSLLVVGILYAQRVFR